MSPYEKINNRLALMLSFPILSILVSLNFIPLVFPIMSQYEGQLFPVIKNVQVDYISNTENGIYVYISFDKIRACEFINISWYNKLGNKLPILFENESREIPSTRPVRVGQKAGPLKLIGIDQLDGSEAIVSHRCHPLWITYTHFYP